MGFLAVTAACRRRVPGNHDVGTWLRQLGPFLGLWLFQRRRRADDVRLRNGDGLFGLRIGWH